MTNTDPTFNYTVSVCRDPARGGDDDLYTSLWNAARTPPDEHEIMSLRFGPLNDQERTALQFLHDHHSSPLGQAIQHICWMHFLAGRKYQAEYGGDTTNLK